MTEETKIPLIHIVGILHAAEEGAVNMLLRDPFVEVSGSMEEILKQIIAGNSEPEIASYYLRVVERMK